MKKIIFIVAILSFSVHCSYSQLSPIGSETLVNTTTANKQQNPDVAMNNTGDYVVVWESFSGTNFDIFAQRYNTAGVAQGAEITINNLTANDQRFPQIAMDNSGGFVVVWQSYNGDGSGWGISSRMFNNTGAAIAPEFNVNTTTTDQQRFSDIAMDDSGNFIIVWENEFDINFQRYNSVGITQGGETIANTYTTSSQNYPSVAMDTDGDFVIVWQSLDQDASDYGIYGQRYNASGTPQGTEFIINTNTADNQLSPTVAMDDTGAFAVTWVSNDTDGSAEGIYARRFDNTGAPLSTDFLVNTTTTGVQDNPSIAMTSEGSFVIAWNSYDQDASLFGVYQQGFNKTGVPVGSETIVNTTTSLFQQFPSVSLKDQTTAVIVWQDGDRTTSSSKDLSDYSVVSQKYNAVALPIELLYFKADKHLETQVIVTWETVSEINNDYFEIEWSEDGLEFRKIGTVDGAGTTNEIQFYDFIHENPIVGINYYRLKQVDFDGTFEYSDIRTVSFETTENIVISPNPTKDYLNINASFSGIIYLIDVNGRVVKQMDLSEMGQMNVSDLSSGVYYLKIGMSVKQIIIQD